jgi:hypothetical protein
VQLLPRTECAEQQELRAGDLRMLREELDETGFARSGRGGEEDARARLQHSALQICALK